MKLAISNIAWEKENNAQVYELMQRSSFTGLEIAPAKLFEDFLHVGSEEIVTFLNELSKYHIKPVAMQSLLFGRPDLQLFDENSRTDLKDYLIKIIDLAAKI
jgi:D-psicose/D-tagatose/L-ribulose 3-epimerase